MANGNSPSISLCLLLILSIALNLVSSSVAMSAESASVSVADSPEVHIVYTERPLDEEPEIHHIRTLALVLGSEDAAREALVYSYKHAASGFSARLTRDQVSEVSKQPGVLQVVPSTSLELHSSGARVGLH